MIYYEIINEIFNLATVVAKLKQRKKECNYMNNQVLPGDYKDTLDSIVNKIKIAQQNATLSANYYLLKLYWDIGNIIVDKKNREDWVNSCSRQIF